MDMDVAEPAIIAPDIRGVLAAGASPTDITIAVDAPARPPRAPEGAPVRRSVPASGDVPALLPRARREVPLADSQLLAAAELIRRGLARQVILVNAAVDSGLPEEWHLRGTPIHLERLPNGRTRVTAGPSRG
jgi:hypothetical protein